MSRHVRTAWTSALALAVATAALTLSPPPTARAADPQASWTVEPAQVALGEPLTLTLRLEHAAAEQLTVERLPRQWGALEVMDQGPVEVEAPELRPGIVLSAQRVRVRAFITGSLAIAPIALWLVDAKGRARPIEPQPGLVQVRGSLISADALPRDIKPQARLAAPNPWPGRLSVMGALLGLGLVLGGSRALRRLQPPLPLAPPPPPDPGAGLRAALRALEQIDALGLPAAGRYKTLYGLTNDVLRTYLVARWGIPAMDRTSAELLAWAQGADWPEPARRELAAALREADLVKFARLSPAPEAAAGLTDRLRDTLRRWEGRPA